MHESPYDDFDRRELVLRDRLAIDRTALANERTLLAYVRTALALAIVGASFVKFFDSVAAELAGCLFLAGGALTLLIGVIRFTRVRRHLSVNGRAVAARTREDRSALSPDDE